MESVLLPPVSSPIFLVHLQNLSKGENSQQAGKSIKGSARRISVYMKPLKEVLKGEHFFLAAWEKLTKGKKRLRIRK